MIISPSLSFKEGWLFSLRASHIMVISAGVHLTSPKQSQPGSRWALQQGSLVPQFMPLLPSCQVAWDSALWTHHCLHLFGKVKDTESKIPQFLALSLNFVKVSLTKIEENKHHKVRIQSWLTAWEKVLTSESRTWPNLLRGFCCKQSLQGESCCQHLCESPSSHHGIPPFHVSQADN